MTPLPVTAGLLHQLVADAHAEGIIAMAATASIDHDGRVLLLIQPGRDFIDHTWQLPTGAVLPGETLTDALPKTLAALGLDLDEILGYLGHHDRIDTDGEPSRVFCFAVTVTDPHSICQAGRIGHWWATPEDLPDQPAPPQPVALAATSAPMNRREPDDPPLAGPLRTGARGLCATEAATELFIRHAAWLHRSDFRDPFVKLATAIAGDTDTAAIDWPAAITALDTGQLPCSGGEASMLRLAASLAVGIPVDLRHALLGLDSRNLDLVTQAVHHATGRRPQPIIY